MCVSVRIGVAVLGACLALGAEVTQAQTTWYVDKCGDEGAGCTGWDDACPDLQTALSLASSGDEIWVAAGTYKPDSGVPSRFATFRMVTGVSVYGGFDGTETLLEERAGLFDQTVLSGHLGADVGSDCCEPNGTPGCECSGCVEDVCSALPSCCTTEWTSGCADDAQTLCPALCGTSSSERSYHVLTAQFVGGGAALDGFVITGGQANGACCSHDRGGAMFVHFSTLTVRNCKLIDNDASNVAAAVWMKNSSVTLVNCLIQDNEVSPGNSGAAIQDVFGSHLTLIDTVLRNNTLAPSNTGGGAIFVGGNCCGRGSTMTATGCTFSGNLGATGGAILNNGLAWMTNTLFIGNEAQGNGFGAENGHGGAIANHGELTVTNCSFSNNTAVLAGGGLSNGFETSNTDLDSMTTVANTVFWGNSAPADTESGQIFSADDDLFIDYSCVEGLTGSLGGTGNIGVDPLFADSAGGNLRLTGGSPCIDAADNTAVPVGVLTDLDGNPRFLDDVTTSDTGNPDGLHPIVDMGAYEFETPSCLDGDGDGMVTICHVPPGNRVNARTLSVSENAVPAHLAHGDACGECAGRGIFARRGPRARNDFHVFKRRRGSRVGVGSVERPFGPVRNRVPFPYGAADLDADGMIEAEELAILKGRHAEP